MPHSPEYVADEAALLVGARAMAAVMAPFRNRGDKMVITIRDNERLIDQSHWRVQGRMKGS